MTELTADQDAVRRYLCDDAPDARLITVRLGKNKERHAKSSKYALCCQNTMRRACGGCLYFVSHAQV